MGDIIKREKRNIILSMITAVVITLLFTIGLSVKLYADSMQSSIASKVIRLHVIANSDSDLDQSLKLEVRDGILTLMKDKIEKCENRRQSVAALKKSLANMQKTAEEILLEHGCRDSVKVTFENCLFPVKQYGNITLPSGYYDAVRIEIGKAEGHNWWCVMYPSLCFYDSNTSNETVYENKLKNILTSEEYSVVAGSDKINVKFAAVEAVKEIERYFDGQ